MSRDGLSERVGVYVDVTHITMNGGRGMRYDALRRFACRQGGLPARLNAYVAHDLARADEEADYRERTASFYAQLRDYGFKVIRKGLRWWTDDEGYEYPKANVEMAMAADALLQSRRLDKVLLVTGDGDFARIARALQDAGCRVEGLAFRSVDTRFREACDSFVPGLLVPDLLPAGRGRGRDEAWGEVGSRVRGVCYRYNAEGGYGFLRYLRGADEVGDNLWLTDTRLEDSPYGSSFVHRSKLPEELDTDRLPSRDLIFEFELAPPRGEDSDSPEAINVELAGEL